MKRIRLADFLQSDEGRSMSPETIDSLRLLKMFVKFTPRSAAGSLSWSNDTRSIDRLPQRVGPLLRDLGDMFPVDCVYARS
jgi:hypothetical protein